MTSDRPPSRPAALHVDRNRFDRRPDTSFSRSFLIVVAGLLLLTGFGAGLGSGLGVGTALARQVDGDGAASDRPLRLAVAGLVHGHVHGVLGALREREDVRLVGVWEEDDAVRAERQEQYDLPDSLLFSDLEAMLESGRPEAVATFTSTYDHPRVVEAAAPRGIHVMMEKPLAVSLEHGRRIVRARDEHDVHVVVNYETTWYRSNQAAYRQVHGEETIGSLRKIIVRDGHEGPEEIGVSEEFLSWLTDPRLNGGGALYDFGCYGANLITWLVEGRRPTRVTATTRQLKTDPVYARVDDEATILLDYPQMQGVVQASWNWPYSRKDMDVYGTEGALLAPTPTDLELRTDTSTTESLETPPLSPPKTGPVDYLRAVARGEIEPEGLSSLENNLVVTEILDAARTSAREGRSVDLPEDPPF